MPALFAARLKIRSEEASHPQNGCDTRGAVAHSATFIRCNQSDNGTTMRNSTATSHGRTDVMDQNMQAHEPAFKSNNR
jgi:hypothetical protein